MPVRASLSPLKPPGLVLDGLVERFRATPPKDNDGGLVGPPVHGASSLSTYRFQGVPGTRSTSLAPLREWERTPLFIKVDLGSGRNTR